MKLVVGLGNPGKRYDRTRHNVGFMVLDELHKELSKYRISDWEQSKKFNAVIAGCTYKGDKVLLVKPLTFMNNSGQSVSLIGNYYKVSPEELVVIQDDKDIPLGEIKVQFDRGAGGHNGIKSIIQYLGGKNFHRIRVGVAASERKMKDTAKFVLGKFGLFEKGTLQEVLKQSVERVFDFLD